MDLFFEKTFSSFSKIGVESKLKTKCGKCKRYMNFISFKYYYFFFLIESYRPTRLYCPTCEETYNLPQNGTIKVYL